MLDLPIIPGIPKFAALLEIACSILVLFYLVQEPVGKNSKYSGAYISAKEKRKGYSIV